VKDRGVPASDLTVLKFADFGSALYGQAIVVNPAFAVANPDAVKGFLRAVTKGILATMKEPGRAITDVLALMDDGARDLELDRLKLVLQDNIITPEVRQNGLGAIDPDRFTTALDQIAAGYKFNKRPALSDIFNDEFLPPLAARRIS
jgi:NitT/TauT family transport system substrate-binding protein